MKINRLNRQEGAVSNLVLPFLAILVYAILIWTLSKPFIGWLSLENADEKGLSSALQYDKDNATYHYLLGRYYHLNITNPDLEKAVKHYTSSVKLNPLQAGAWINLSKVYQIKGQNDKAEHALKRAVKLNPNNPDLMWDAATFWLINNMSHKAVSALKQYILLMPERQREVYDLCWKLRLNNEYIFASLVPGSYSYQSRYLMYLLSTKRTDESREVWAILDKDNLDRNLFISYVNFLINNSLYDDAETAWKKITDRIEDLSENDPSSLIWNPSFENEILNGGFDWSVREVEGADVFLDDIIRMKGSRSIGVTFDGRHNPDITIAQQVVRVNPGTPYKLKGYIKTSSITTTNGIFISVQGHKCSGLNKNSDTITGSTFWREVSVDFETPVDCNAIIVKIRRARSTKFANKIEGTAWIDGITLKQMTDLTKSRFKKL